MARHDVSGGCCAAGAQPLPGVLRCQPSERWLGSSVLGKPPAPPCSTLQGTRSVPTAHSRQVRRQRRSFTPLPVCPSICSESPRHSWLTGLWLRLSHISCQEGKSRETAPGARVPPMDFSATCHKL